MDDLIEDFIAETRETLEALTSQLVEWERRPNDRASRAFRGFYELAPNRQGA
jgi:chemotaxis protein histidine kinase CheA